MGNFLPFYHPNSLKNQNLKRMKKKPGDIIIIHKCSKNYDHMLFCSWDIVRDRCNSYFSFWAIFCPFTVQKIKILKKWRKKTPWRYHHFTYMYQKLWSDDVWFLRYSAQQTRYLWWGTYTSIPTWIHSKNSLTAAEALSLKISLPWNISQMITKTIPLSTRIVISYAMKQASHFEFHRKSMETETTTWSEFPDRGKAFVKLSFRELCDSKSHNSLSKKIGQKQKGRLWVHETPLRTHLL